MGRATAGCRAKRQPLGLTTGERTAGPDAEAQPAEASLRRGEGKHPHVLRGDYKQSEYGRVILPLTVARRLDAALEPTKDAALAEVKALTTSGTTSAGTSPALARAREIIGKFKFGDNITRLDEAGLLYLVLAEFARPELDLHPRRVSPVQMGHIFEELGTEAWRGGHIGDIIDVSWGSGRDIQEWWASQSRARR